LFFAIAGDHVTAPVTKDADRRFRLAAVATTSPVQKHRSAEIPKSAAQARNANKAGRFESGPPKTKLCR
jgi:hypothetical protein